MFINFIYKHDRVLAMHQGAPSFIRLNDSSSRVLLQKNTSTLPITMAKPAFLPPYSPRMYSSSVYSVYLPFYRVKNPISPSLPMVLGLSHHTPLHHSVTFTKEVPSSMNIGAGDPTRPIPPSLDVNFRYIEKNYYSFSSNSLSLLLYFHV